MTSVDNRPLRVFLCHSSADKPAVRELYQKLRAEPWIEPWLDEEELFPGMDWNMEIEKAIEATDVILVCLSNNSITKEGYVQREIRIALDYADYKPEGTLFIIPVRLEECISPKRLARLHHVNYFGNKLEREFERLLVSLRRRRDNLGLKSTGNSRPLILSTKFDIMRMPPPVTQTMTTFVYGDDLYDEAFSIDTEAGVFLGEYGVELPDFLDSKTPKKTPVLTAWIFDKNDINTKKKVLLPHQLFNNQVIIPRLEKIGEIVAIEHGSQTLLETSTLQMLITVVDLEIKASNPNILSTWFISRLTLELAVWTKN